MPDAERLKRIADRLRRAEEIDEDLRAARRRQLHMLPELPDMKDIELAASFRPVDDVGGDFYDVIRIGGHMLGVIVADVAGHGVEAALVMGMAIKAFQIYARGVASPAMVLKAVNSELHGDLRGELFFTCAYAVYDERRKTVRVARAGHPPPVLLRPADDPPTSLVLPAGMAIGFDAGGLFDAAMGEETLEMRPGDTLILYTDGVTELPGGEGREGFDEAKLLGAVSTLGGLPASKVVESLDDLLENHLGSATPFDDRTIIAMGMPEG